MGSPNKITIAGADYPVRYGFSAFREMGKMWKCDSLQEVMMRLSMFEKIDESKGLTFDDEDVLCDIVIAGVTCARSKELPQREDIIELIYSGSDFLGEVLGYVAESIPQVDQGKPMPAKKAGKKKKA